MMLALLVACGGDDDSIDAGDGGGRDATTTDVGLDSGDVEDTGADTGFDSTVDAGCVGERDEVLCSSVGATCGTIAVTDRCGVERTPSCGTCTAPDSCGIDEANQCANADWVLTTIDDGGERVALALGASDSLHVAFRNDRELWYGAFVDESWVTEQIDDPILGGDIAIAFDASGVVHVAATAGSTTPSRTIDLWTLDDGEWAQTLIDGLSVTSIDLVFDGDAAQLCGYHPPMAGFGGILTHFGEGAGGFTSTIVDGVLGASSSREGNYCSLGFDGSDLHVAYHGGQFQRLEYASESAGAWTVQNVDEPDGEFAGEHVSIAIDSSGEPVIAYQALGVIADRQVRVARPDGAAWTIETVDPSAGIIAINTAIALDSGDLAHITYFDSTPPGTLRYARETAAGFELSDVAVVGTGRGGFNDIAIDSTGRVHIVFFDSTSDTIMHATPR